MNIQYRSKSLLDILYTYSGRLKTYPQILDLGEHFLLGKWLYMACSNTAWVTRNFLLNWCLIKLQTYIWTFEGFCANNFKIALTAYLLQAKANWFINKTGADTCNMILVYCKWCWRNKVKLVTVLLNLKHELIYRKE